MNPRTELLFAAGDALAGALTAVAVTMMVRVSIWPGFDMVAAMMVGMLLGTITYLVLGMAFSPLLGMFETMVPGMFIGMFGGMLFAMRDSMQRIPLATALAVGAVFGVAVVFGIRFWNVQLRRRSRPVRPEPGGVADEPT